MDARDELLEMRQANYERALTRISDKVTNTMESMERTESDIEALLVLQMGTIQLLSDIAMSLASIEWLGIIDKDR